MGKVTHAVSQAISQARGVRRLASLTVASCAMVGTATAADVMPVDSGLLKFTNVTVVNAPAVASTTAAAQTGMRVYKDSATGEMRGPTSDELQSEATATRSAPATRAAGARQSSASDASTSAMTSYASNGGGVAQTLDESFLQYSVVVRQPDGSLAEICVTGSDKADEVNRIQPHLKQTKEIAHDR